MLDSALFSVLRMLLPVISEAGTKEEMCFQGQRECLATMLQGLAEIKAEACSLPELLAFLFIFTYPSDTWGYLVTLCL